MEYLSNNDELKNNPMKSYSQVSWVYACVNAIASTISSAPIVFYRTTKSKRELIERDTHELYKLFNPPKAPGIPSLRELLFRTFVHMGITGICYWVFYRKGGKLKDVDLKVYGQMFPVYNAKKELVGWVEKRDGQVIATFDRDMVIPMRYYDPFNPMGGLPPLKSAALAIKQDNNIAEWNAGFFKTGMRTPMVLETDKTLTPKQRKELRKELNDFYSGATNGHGAFIADGGMKATPVPLSAKDLDFIEGKQLTREEICAAYGVPPAIVGIFRYANYSNVKEQRKIFWEQTLLPKMRSLTDLIQINLLNADYPDIEIDWGLNEVFGLKPEMTDVAASAKTYFDMGYNMEQIALILDTPYLSPAYLTRMGAGKGKNLSTLDIQKPQAGPAKPGENVGTEDATSNGNPPASNPKPNPNRPKPANPQRYLKELSLRREKMTDLFDKYITSASQCLLPNSLESVKQMYLISAEKEFDRICKDAVCEVGIDYIEWSKDFQKGLFPELDDVRRKFLFLFDILIRSFSNVKSGQEKLCIDWKNYFRDNFTDFFAISIYNLAKHSAMLVKGIDRMQLITLEGESVLEVKELPVKTSRVLDGNFLVFEKNSVIVRNCYVSPVLEVN